MRSDTASIWFSSLIGTGIVLYRVIGQFHSRRCLDATRLHFPTADRIAFDHVTAGRRRMLRVAAQVDAAVEHIRLAERRTAELPAILVAVRGVDMAQPVAQDPVPRAYYENPAELHSVELVVFDQNVPRLHVGIGIVEDNSEMTERVILGFSAIDASVAANRAVMKAVQIDAFAVDLLKAVEVVAGAFDVTRGVDRHWRSSSLHIH